MLIQAWLPESALQLPDNEDDITSDSDYEDDWTDDVLQDHNYD